MKTSICLFLAVITCASVTVAQSKKDKVEIGVQTTSLTLFDPDFGFDHTRPGVGGRVTYNFNRSIAAEAEINYFPQRQADFSPDDDMIQAQFGVKLGKRFEKFGLFAKVRPGFLTVDQGFSVRDSVVVINGVPEFVPKFERTFTFTLDAGGVLEWYPSRRTVVRFEAGDTIIRHPAQFDVNFSEAPFVREVRPPKFNHNFQFTAGVGFRLGDFPAEGVDVTTSKSDKTPRFELGAQFTSMTVAPVTRDNPCPDCLSSDFFHTEPGFGGRFTFNFIRPTPWKQKETFLLASSRLACQIRRVLCSRDSLVQRSASDLRSGVCSGNLDQALWDLLKSTNWFARFFNYVTRFQQ